jgi:hypothetical protein
MAGVAELLCEKGDQVLQLKHLDPFEIGKHYRCTDYFDNIDHLVEAGKFIEDNFDHTIIHFFPQLLPEFPSATMYFHGTDLRNGLKEYNDFALLSTPDLLQYCPKGQVMEVPVDIEHFKKTDGERHTTWFSFSRKDLIDLIHEQYPKCTVVDRKASYYSYEIMPTVLNNIKNYVDCKYDYSKPPKPIYANSATAIQALACGCIVHTHNGEILPNSLLKDHDRETIIGKFKKCLEVQNLVRN